MTDLLPQGDKVSIYLAEGESVTVPEGKVWVVSLITDREGLLKVTIDGNFGRLRDDEGKDSSISKITVHENVTVEASDFDEGGIVTGWEFDYVGE